MDSVQPCSTCPINVNFIEVNNMGINFNQFIGQKVQIRTESNHFLFQKLIDVSPTRLVLQSIAGPSENQVRIDSIMEFGLSGMKLPSGFYFEE